MNTKEQKQLDKAMNIFSLKSRRQAIAYLVSKGWGEDAADKAINYRIDSMYDGYCGFN